MRDIIFNSGWRWTKSRIGKIEECVCRNVRLQCSTFISSDVENVVVQHGIENREDKEELLEIFNG